MPRSPSVLAWATLAALALSSCGEAPKQAPAAAPPLVHTLTLVAEDVAIDRRYVGRTVSRSSVEIRPRITGYLQERPYSEGKLAHAGDVLFRIDPREFQANLDSNLARQAQAAAQVAKARNDLARVAPLAEAGAAPRQELDDATSGLQAAEADLRAADAAVRTARLTLDYATITAPFTGLVGKSTVDVGGVVSPGASSPLAVIDQVDPMAVEFTVAEQELLEHRANVAAGKVVGPGKDEFLLFHATLLNGTPYSETGRLDFSDVRIKADTGTALLRTLFPNPKGALVPGQFVRVGVSGLVLKNAILVPKAAVLLAPTGATVFVLDAQGRAQARLVKLDQWIGERWVIDSGLQAGERILTSNLQQVHPGATVRVAEDAPVPAPTAEQPAPAAAPGN